MPIPLTGDKLRLTVLDVMSGAHRVDWCQPISQPGYPWGSGVLYLEHRTDLHPLTARGYSGPGEFHKQQYIPQVQAAIKRPLRALATMPLRIERPELPEWATIPDMIAAARHWALCQRVWARLTADKKLLTRFIREVIMGAAIDGFYLGEIVCDEVVSDHEGIDARYWYPRLPDKRAAWTVRYWLTQRERPIGVILDASRAVDYSGGNGPSWAVVPWRKLVHVAAEQQGSNLEGVSWLRDVINLVKMLQQAYQLEALAAEVNGVGEPHFILPEGHPADGPVASQLRTYLKRRKAGQAGGAVHPFGTQIHTISPQSILPDFSGVIGGLTRDIMLGLDASDMLIALNGTGAFAAREEATADARDGYDYIAQEYVAAPLTDVLRKAIEINYPADIAAGRCFVPRVQWGVVEERNNEDWIATLAMALGSGLLSPSDVEAARPIVRELLDVPDPGDVGEGGEAFGPDAVGPEDDPITGRWVAPSEVAQIFGIKPSTVVAWIKSGTLKGSKLGGGRWRVDLASVRAMVSKEQS